MDVLSVSFGLLIALILYYIVCRLTEERIPRLINKIPGPIRLPILGTIYIILFTPKEDFFRLANERLRKYGHIIRTWLGSIPVVHLMTPEDVEIILNNSVQITKSDFYKPLHPWLGDGLLTSTGEKWHRHRKLITPTFHFKILENFMEVFVDKSRMLVNFLKTKANCGEAFDLYPYITRCTLDIICETAMGVQINAMKDDDNEYVKCIYEITKMTVDRLLKPWLHPDVIYYNIPLGKTYLKHVRRLHDFTRRVIDERRKLLKEQNSRASKGPEDDLGEKKRRAFLDLFLEMSEDDGGFTDLEIREQVDTFMFEGHDTTTAGISWSLFLLGNHPVIQEEVYREIDAVFDSCNGAPTVADLARLKLLERCIKEALRLYPSVPTIGRLLTEDVEVEGYTLPAGCAVNVQIFLLHRDENIYPEPDRFDPDRFLPENVKDRHPYAYIPFSAGARNCIGQKFAMYEEKTLLAHIIKNYKVKAMETQETVRPMMELVLRPLRGLRVTLEPRNKT